jgi:hypothetical protein
VSTSNSRLLTGGSINLSYGRDERRTLDCTLDNQDGLLRPNPHGGFWYDKVIKAYKGFRYSVPTYTSTVVATNLALNPRVEGGVTNISHVGGGANTRVYDTSVKFAGSGLAKFTLTAGGFTGCGWTISSITTAGTVVNWTCWVRPSATVNIQAYAEGTIVSTSAFTSFTGGPNNISCPANTWSKVTGSFTLAADRSVTRVGYIVVASQATGFVHNGDQCIVTTGSPSTFFSGATPGARWTGTADASTSELLATVQSGSIEKTWETQVGEFVIDGISDQNFPSSIHVVGRDYTKRMALSKIPDSLTFSSSTKVHQVVEALASNASIGKLKLPTNSPPLGTDLAVERGTSRWDIARDACAAKSIDLYFDALGRLVMNPYPDPAVGPIEVVFETGPKVGNISKIDRSTNDSEIFNDIIVIGERPNEENALPYYGRATNKVESSPTNINRIGTRTKVVTLSSLGSDAEARQLARQTLKVSALESYELSIEALSYPWLDVGIVGQIKDPDALPTEPSRYLIDSMNLNLGLGTSTITGKRVTMVGTIDEVPDPEPDPEDPPVPDVPDTPDTPEPPPATEPEPETPTNTEELRVATYNISGIGTGNSVITSIENIMAESDLIGIQEGGDQGKIFAQILARNPQWGLWKGDNLSKQESAIFYRKSKGKVVFQKGYLAHERQFVGNNGVSSTIQPKYVMRLDLELNITGRRITHVNTHMLPSATRSRESLGAAEYAARRAHYTKHMQKLTDVIDASTSLLVGTGDMNSTPTFPLNDPLFARVTMSHSFDTLGNRLVDFVYKRNHNAISVVSSKKLTAPTIRSDHDCVIVTYKIRK